LGFLRRLLGGAGPAPVVRDAADPGAAPPNARDWSDEDERAHELELARFEQGRTTELMRRQQRYGDRAWTPPAQGGERRADDGETGGEAG
jgi:hypothetical protein